MRFGSLCSGIEAASAAWKPLGWEAAFFSEIDKNACKLLAHHYPDVPNYGDMTRFMEWKEDESIDVLCGGTPCQDYSIAGLRAGLSGARGQLSLVYGEIAARYRPDWLVWENVPGVLSSNGGRDFAEFLGLLCGQKVYVPLDGWGTFGVIPGYKNAYGIAYRVLDAQYFGVAQRRRRVFVIGYLGDWRPAAAVLLERESLSRDPAPSRKTGQRVAGTLTAGAFSGGAGGRPEGAAGGHFQPVGSHWDDPANPHPSLSQSHNTGGIGQSNQEVFSQRGSGLVPVVMAHGQGGAEIAQGHAPTLTCNHEAPILAHTLRGEGFDASEDGSGRQTLIPAYGIPGNWIGREPENGGNATEPMHDLSPCLTRADRHGVVAFSAKDYGNDASYELSPTLRAGNSDTSHANSGNWMAIAQPFGVGEDPDLAHCLRAQASRADKHESTTYIAGQSVRRLTPVECERLQGFPDNYTKISEKTADGPRYKELGNSWAVPNIRWLGKRIDMVEAILKGL